MGFFSDLKEDLSQAVNELIPEEEMQEEVMEEQPEETIAVEDFNEEKFAEEEVTIQEEETVMENKDMTDTLESLLAQIDMQETPAPSVAPQTSGISFSSNKSSVSDEVAVVTAGMKVKGDMTSDGSLDVIGTIEGNIDILGKLNVTGTITGNSKATEIYAENAKITGEVRSDGSVKIGQSSVIIGNIFATSAVIAGAVKGDIDVHGPVILDTSAIVMGNIKSKSVQINNGAVIEGMCSQCYADVNPTSFFEEFKKRK